MDETTHRTYLDSTVPRRGPVFLRQTNVTFREEVGRGTGSIRIVKTVHAADGQILWEMDVCEVDIINTGSDEVDPATFTQ